MTSNATGFSVLPRFEQALPPFVAELLASDLAAFAKYVWPILEPRRTLHWSWHFDYLCEVLALVKQRELRRVIINVPPRTLKSTLITIIFPIWIWISEPEHRFLIASYSRCLSEDHSIKRRKVIQSRRFRRLFSDRFHLTGGRNRVDQFMNDRGGEMTATSIGGTAQGRGCETAIVDDPISADRVPSDAERTTANNWFSSTLRTRLNEPATGAIILVMQRLHQLDPTGFLLEREPGMWTHVRIPLVAEENERWVFPLSGRILERTAGEVLLPTRFTPSVINELRSDALVFAGQQQQRPAPIEGNLIKRNHVRLYGGVDPRTGLADEVAPRSFDMKLISVDCSFKDSPTSDYVAILVIGIKGSKRFVLDVVNARLDAAATEREIRRQHDRHRPVGAILIEDKANGPAVIQRLKLNVPRVIAINPQGGKVARMAAASPEWEAGDWFLDRNNTWTEAFIEQITMFPNSRHDDMADAMTQAAAWLLRVPAMPTITISNAFTGEIIAQY